MTSTEPTYPLMPFSPLCFVIGSVPIFIPLLLKRSLWLYLTNMPFALPLELGSGFSSC